MPLRLESWTSSDRWIGDNGTRGGSKEGEYAPQEDRGLVQGDPQGRTDPDPGRAPGLPREGTEGDEGHRRDRLPSLHVRSVRDGRIREGLQDEGAGHYRRERAHPGPHQAHRAGGREGGRAETGETHRGSQGAETVGGR